MLDYGTKTQKFVAYMCIGMVVTFALVCGLSLGVHPGTHTPTRTPVVHSTHTVDQDHSGLVVQLPDNWTSTATCVVLTSMDGACIDPSNVAYITRTTQQ
jgi:hypothetical protein